MIRRRPRAGSGWRSRQASTACGWRPVTWREGPDAVPAAMLAGDVPALLRMDDELVPFYCRECAAAYCEAHWDTCSVFDDDDPGWFDELRGRCPMGHERRIYD